MYLLRWLYNYFFLLMWCFPFIDLCKLNHPCSSKINPTWSWWMILLLCCWIWFETILLKTFVIIFIRDIVLCIIFLWCSPLREGNGTPLQYSCLENPMDREAWSMRSRRVGHDWTTSLSLFSFMHWRRKWQHIPVFLPGESQGAW